MVKTPAGRLFRRNRLLLRRLIPVMSGNVEPIVPPPAPIEQPQENRLAGPRTGRKKKKTGVFTKTTTTKTTKRTEVSRDTDAPSETRSPCSVSKRNNFPDNCPHAPSCGSKIGPCYTLNKGSMMYSANLSEPAPPHKRMQA